MSSYSTNIKQSVTSVLHPKMNDKKSTEYGRLDPINQSLIISASKNKHAVLNSKVVIDLSNATSSICSTPSNYRQVEEDEEKLLDYTAEDEEDNDHYDDDDDNNSNNHGHNNTPRLITDERFVELVGGYYEKNYLKSRDYYFRTDPDTSYPITIFLGTRTS